MAATPPVDEMKMYFHGGVGGDLVWFRSWRPTSTWGTIAVCMAIFLLAGFERWLMAARRGWEHDWSTNTNESDQEPVDTAFLSPDPGSALRRVSSNSIYQPLNPIVNDALKAQEERLWPPLFPPEGIARPQRFRWRVDLCRGALQSAQTALHYALMLVVMTFNIWWTLSVIVGAGVGEVCFGRLGAGHNGGNH